VEATLSDQADELAKLWDSHAVRIEPGHPVEIGRAVIYADDKRWEASNTRPRTLCYKSEIQDLQISSDWAFEWGYFSYRDSTNSTAMRGKVLRVLKRQPDGSWKFARVMGFPEKVDSAAPMAHPCD
jgi:ketosteroid isomerase-like protein